ncbi:hypothetical protein M9H77_03054 [Catharanthus roseus]|uniref:Uncharacterized protein n=1 Tax=Catharanthus roseus TaxID=4058 RepID=A0ACC0CA74_CATRO|nr:hypothetical protein M9H77_03054 [Catharanthus roseus]
MALVMRKFKRIYKKDFNRRGKNPPFKRGQSLSLFKARYFEYNSIDHLVADCSKAIEKEKRALEAKLEASKKKRKITKKNKELKNKIDNLSNENSKLVCENKTLLKSLEVVKKESDSSKLEFQKLILENKDLCEKVFSLEKCMVDYDDLKKKVSDLTLCIEKFTNEKENFEKLLCSQRSSFDKSGIGYNHTNTSSKQTCFVKTSSPFSHFRCIYCEKNFFSASLSFLLFPTTLSHSLNRNPLPHEARPISKSNSYSSSQIFQISLLTKQTNRLLFYLYLSNPLYLKTLNLYLKTLSQDSFNMVKTKNTNVGHGEARGSSRGCKKGRGKQVARSETPLDKFISVQVAANYEEWIQKKSKIALGHRVDLSDMRGNGKIIAFDDKLLNSILETPEDGMYFYTKNKKCFDPNLYSEKRFEDLFTKGIMLKRSEDRTVDKLDAYGRILHHIISNIIIPNVGHKSSITNMHSFVMLAMHEHRKMNFNYIAIEHILATQSSSTKCFPYGCFLTKVFQHFKITFFGPNEHIGISKIYNQNTFKRMGFERNYDEVLIRGGQQGSDDDDDKEDNGDNEEGNEPENMDEDETNEEDI